MSMIVADRVNWCYNYRRILRSIPSNGRLEIRLSLMNRNMIPILLETLSAQRRSRIREKVDEMIALSWTTCVLNTD